MVDDLLALIRVKAKEQKNFFKVNSEVQLFTIMFRTSWILPSKKLIKHCENASKKYLNISIRNMS